MTDDLLLLWPDTNMMHRHTAAATITKRPMKWSVVEIFVSLSVFVCLWRCFLSTVKVTTGWKSGFWVTESSNWCHFVADRTGYRRLTFGALAQRFLKGRSHILDVSWKCWHLRMWLVSFWWLISDLDLKIHMWKFPKTTQIPLKY